MDMNSEENHINGNEEYPSLKSYLNYIKTRDLPNNKQMAMMYLWGEDTKSPYEAEEPIPYWYWDLPE